MEMLIGRGHTRGSSQDLEYPHLVISKLFLMLRWIGKLFSALQDEGFLHPSDVQSCPRPPSAFYQAPARRRHESFKTARDPLLSILSPIGSAADRGGRVRAEGSR